jgi:hypothetical protein
MHFLFSTKHSNNLSRSLTTILQFLGASFAVIAEAHTTLQRVCYITRFISYLIRYGLSSFNKYGSRTLKQLTKITEAFATNKHTDETDNTKKTYAHCQMYTDQKKGENLQHSYRQRTNSIDFINSLIYQYQIESYEEFRRKIPSQIKIRLLKDVGYIGQNLVRQLIKIHITEIHQKINSTNYLSLVLDNFDISQLGQDNVRWIQQFFNYNNIDFTTFLCDFIAIHSMNYPKINTFIIKGPTNTGKTLILNLLLTTTKPTRILTDDLNRC